MNRSGNSRNAGKGERSDWQTPDYLFKKLDDIFMFTIDVAANKDNAKCDIFINEKQDAFKTNWHTAPIRNSRFFLNMPWGREYRKRTGIKPIDWVERLIDQYRRGRNGVMLCSASVNARWWQRAASYASIIVFPAGRVNYTHPSAKLNQCNFDSTILVFHPMMLSRAIELLNKIGQVARFTDG